MKSCVVVSDTGLSVLQEPEDAGETSVDVVFVHGLQGHPRRTWAKSSSRKRKPTDPHETPLTTKRKLDVRSWFRHTTEKTHSHVPPPKAGSSNGIDTEDDDDVYWPQSLLGSDCPNARIMTWGYDSKVTKFFGGAVNQNSFYEHAQDLVSALERGRRDARSRPLIFVAHSLGGIIVKQALFTSKRDENRADVHDIYKSTAVLFFLGTPHRGSDYAAWGHMAERIAAAAHFDTNSALIDHLAINGLHLAQLSKNFESLIVLRTFDIYSYQEAKGYKGVRGLNGKVVDEFSSFVGDPGREHTETINANHMDMCRFESKEDPGYKQVGADIAYRVKIFSQELQVKLALEREDILEKLDAIEMGGNHITAPYDETALWLIDDPRFKNWFGDEHGLFWLKGKPGSGKSTLLKNMWLTIKSKPYILNCGPIITASFFFNTRGTAQERKLDNMLRTLLFHLIEQDKDQYKKVLPELKDLFLTKAKSTGNSQSNLRRVLTLCLTKVIRTTTNKRIFMFVDAIDESDDEDLDDVIATIETLAKAQNSEKNAIDIVITSRPDTAVQFDMTLGRELDLENENRKDIIMYVEKELNRYGKVAYGAQRHHALGQRVLEKANGVFLWVCLVVPRLRRCVNRGDTLSQLLKVLEEIPDRLHDLFCDIISRINRECLGESLRMLQIATLSSRPLSIEEFRHAFGFIPGQRHRSVQDWELSGNFIEPGPQILQLIQSRSGGLLEVREARGRSSHLQDKDELYPSPSDQFSIRHPDRAHIASQSMTAPRKRDDLTNFEGSDDRDTTSALRVQLIHDTAKKFFSEGGGFNQIESIIRSHCSSTTAQPVLFQSPSGCFRIGGHHHVAHMCVSYMTMSSLYGVLLDWIQKRRLRRQPPIGYPFFAYASENWLFHVTEAERGGMPQLHICQTLLDLFPKFVDEMIFLAATYNLKSWLTWFKDHQIVDFDTPELGFGLPIRSAVRNDNIDAVQILLNGGAHVNGSTGGFETTLSLAVKRKNQEMMKLLYIHGATCSQAHWIPTKDTKVRVVTEADIENLGDEL